MTKVIVADIINELKNLIRRDRQVVRPRSATPLSPVQIRLAPLEKALENISGAFSILWFTHREFYGILFTIIVGRAKQNIGDLIIYEP